MKTINLLNQAKTNTKKLNAISKKENANALKEFKKIQSEITKAKKSEKQIESDKIKLSWLNDTQSKTALEKYVKSNPEKFEKYLTLTNELNSTKITINKVNKQLFKFGHKHELNKLDYNGNILETKSFFNINYFVANANSLLNRYAKFKDSNNNAFLSYSENLTNTYLDNKFKKLQIDTINKGAKKSDVMNIVGNTEIDRNAKAKLIKALID
jgi:hypothetical protein